MDFSLVTGAVASLKAAKEISSALLEARDFSQGALKLAELNGLLLKAQDSLFSHNAQLLELQDQHFETRKELRELKEAIAERKRYSLVEMSPGTFAYKSHVVPAQSAAGEPVAAEPEHYLCQPCYDKRVKSVLQRSTQFGTVYAQCRICDARFPTGETVPYSSHISISR